MWKVTDAKGNVTEYTLTVTRESSNRGSSDSDSSGSGSSGTSTPVKPNESGIETSLPQGLI
jgi:hypothetical protein